MRRPMRWSEAACDGFALAATLAGDRGAELGLSGLHPEARATLGALAVQLAALPKAARHARIAQIIAQRVAGQPASEHAAALETLRTRMHTEKGAPWDA